MAVKHNSVLLNLITGLVKHCCVWRPY